MGGIGLPFVTYAIVPYSAEPVLQSVMRCHRRAVEPYAVGCMPSLLSPRCHVCQNGVGSDWGDIRRALGVYLSTGAFSERWSSGAVLMVRNPMDGGHSLSTAKSGRRRVSASLQ